MSFTVVTSLFVVLMAMVVAWLGLVFWIFRRLRIRHSATYESIGSPSLFWNNSMRNNRLFLKFLFGPTRQHLGDRQLGVVVRVMQVILVTYTAGFAMFMVLLLTIGVR
jgi:hypothetical protein